MRYKVAMCLNFGAEAVYTMEAFGTYQTFGTYTQVFGTYQTYCTHNEFLSWFNSSHVDYYVSMLKAAWKHSRRDTRGGFRGVSEVSRNHSGFSLDDGCAPFGYNVHEAYTAGWIAVLLHGFCFSSKLRKCSEDVFLVTTKENWRHSQKFVLQRHRAWKLCAKIFFFF